MISKNNEQVESLSRKNIRVGEILVKSREKHKSIKKENQDSFQYGTDSKKKSNSQSYMGDIEDLRAVIQSCESCMEKISQFTTKKPKHTKNWSEDKSTQTIHKPFLIDLVEERVNQICRQNRKLTKALSEKETELLERQAQIVEIEQKFTTILYSLGQQLSYLKTVAQDSEEIKQSAALMTETPSYLKALFMETKR